MWSGADQDVIDLDLTASWIIRSARPADPLAARCALTVTF
jgi:hypothetical protein